MADTAAETDRTVVKTYVPEYQKAAWRDHADALDMSQSEFVRAMVQAGRRRFDREEPGSEGSSPGGDGLEDRVLDVLSADDHRSWDQIRQALVSDLDDRLDEALRDLQEQNAVAHSGRHGGYRLVETDE